MKTKVTLLVLWVALVGVGSGLARWKDATVTSRTTPIYSSHDALISLVGEFRTVLARYLWFKVELYHESAEEQGGEAEAEVVPLMRLVTLLDPSMVESYDQIAWDLFKAYDDPDTAVSLVEEGLARNPDSYQLNFRRAFFAYEQKEDEIARRYAASALVLTQDRFEQLDCLRLIYWSAKRDNLDELRRRALDDLLRLNPGDPLYTKELQELESAAGKTP